MYTEEKTFVAIKPDAVKRGYIGEIIARFERRGYKITAMKMLQVTKELAEKHYAEHIGKPFYSDLVRYITSGPIVAMVLQGYNAVQGIRHILGATDPGEADVGTIRADYGQLKAYNVVHGSDSLESAEREISLYFTPGELCPDYKNMMELVIESVN